MALKRKTRKKYFTVAEANATLPLLRSILRDLTELAQELGERYQRLTRLQGAGHLDQAHQEEIQVILAEYEQGQEKMKEYEKELRGLHVELKDYVTGLIDFPCMRNGREVYLCWRMDEPTVNHWHDLNAGFAGRKKLTPDS